MIPRYQRILFWLLLGSSLLMTLFLIHGCQQAHKKLTALADTTPIQAPSSSTEDVTLYLAADADGSITPTQRQLALPADPTLRARTLLDRLLAEYTLPNSAHPLQSGPSIDDVFLLDAPTNPTASALNQLAVINLNSAFLTHHPSGVEVEDLTLQSILGTLHAAFPRITQVRFLVDGQPRETIAGHADLLRTYTPTDTTYQPNPPELHNLQSSTPQPNTPESSQP